MKAMKMTMIFAAMIFMATSCTSVHKSMREPNAHIEFVKGDFQFSEQLSASATSTMILTIDWKRVFNQKTGSVVANSAVLGIDFSSIPVIGGVVSDKTSSYALYELMQNNPGYDVVFYPQFETKTEKPILGIGFIYKTTTVHATARLGKIK